MYVHLEDGTWQLVWKVTFLRSGVAKLWISSRQFVALAPDRAQHLRHELQAQDPAGGRPLVWVEAPVEEPVDGDTRAIAGRVGNGSGR